jgi:hypothetical protein
MLESRQRHDWAIASSVMALVANIHRDPKRSSLIKPSQFDPFARRAASTTIRADVSVLKDVFIHGKFPKEVSP